VGQWGGRGYIAANAGRRPPRRLNWPAIGAKCGDPGYEQIIDVSALFQLDFHVQLSRLTARLLTGYRYTTIGLHLLPTLVLTPFSLVAVNEKRD
jgi:hypothetical protein